jgi:DNA gyrase subunit A
MAEFKPIIEHSMKQYAGAVLQSRALVDVRDCLKPSARQIFYCMDKYKYTADKPFQKTMAAIGDAMKHFYIHGDSSCEGIIMRAGQTFAMRYPLVEVKGNGGTMLSSGNWAAPRYTDARLSKLASYLFEDIDKETIEEWRDNYADNEQYPGVLPTKGFYNLVNGTSGIGIGMASSVPQYNLKELNNALIHLIDNPDCSFDEIYCAPDFATGAILYNESEVKESMKKGTGFACKLRSVVDFDSKERCFVITEIPYSVYTDTICSQLEEIVNGEDNPGIERFNDLTGAKPLIKIYLNKKANPDKVLRYLYKNTSLQYHYGINFTMLDNGRFPKVFTWKEMLQAHIDHEKVIYRRGFEFDLNKIKKRIHIIDGLLICMANIEEVVQTIRNSASATAASSALQTKFLLDADQTKAVLDMKLSRLAHLEVQKLENEKTDLTNKAASIERILNDKILFQEEIKKGLREVASKFGDARRTKIYNLVSNGEEEPTEIKQLQISLTNKGAIFITETSTLYTQKRGGVGNKLKMADGEFVIDTQPVASNEELLFFTTAGNVYHYAISNLTFGEKIYVQALFNIPDWDSVCAITSTSKKELKPYILFFTKKGMVKKSEIGEYNLARKAALKALTLDSGDEIVNVLFMKEEKVGILTEMGNFIMIETADIRPIGRIAKGVKAIKLNDDDNVANARIIPMDTISIASISGGGLFKKTGIEEFAVQGRGTKGSKIQKLNEADWMADFLPITHDGEILVASTHACIKLTTNDIPVYSKGALGNKSIKMGATDNVVGISIY